MDFKKTTLSNGLRIITVPDKTAQTTTVLVLVAAGSKYETKANNGVSHFLEHMFFKGTDKRPSTLKIAETLDDIGGAYNAFTSKEITGYWAKVDSSHADLALDWVSDIYINSKLRKADMEKERGVIIEEINMRLDSPMGYVGDLWEKLLYGDQPAGWEIIGTKQNILNLQRKDILNYLKNHYSAKNTIVCVAGKFNQRDFIQQIRSRFAGVNKQEPCAKESVKERQCAPQTLCYFKKTDQTHLCIGVRGFGLLNFRRYAQNILAVILGGNMSSRLFINVREKRGLAYYIRTSSEAYTDSGYLVTQAGVPNTAVNQAIQLILAEYSKVSRTITRSELRKAQDYLKGSLALSLESSDSQASFYAGQELLTDNILTVKQKCVKIDKVRLSDIKKLAKEIFVLQNLNIALIGPHNEIVLQPSQKTWKDHLSSL